MNKPQILAIVICLVLVVFLFREGSLSSTADLSDRKKPETTNKTLAFDDQSFFDNSLQSMSPDLADQLRNINADIEKSRNVDQKIALINKAGSLCDSAALMALTGFFSEKMATIKQTTSAWLYVSNRYTNAIQFARLPAERNYLINKGKAAARKALSIEPGNLDAQGLLAQCIIDQSDDSIMTVIPILKNIEQKDSNNVAAIYNLAMLSIKSGQTDKAIPRFRQLIRIEPMNPENYYQLADLLAVKGEKKEALKQLEICKSLLKSADQIKLIDEKIKEINNK